MSRFFSRKAFVISALLFLVSFKALGVEEILSFDSQVQVSQQGDLTVKETIRVNAEGKQIKRGLVRKLPANYERKHSLATLFSGRKVVTVDPSEFTIKEVLIDGQKTYDWKIDKRAYGEYLTFHDFYLARIQEPSVVISVIYQRTGTDDEFNRHDFEKEVSTFALERGLYIDYVDGYREHNVVSHYLSRLWHGHLFSLNDRQELEILSVLKDGKRTNWFIKEEHGFKVIYVGSRNVFLEPGEYEYTIDYRYAQQSWRADNTDKISWNVTGNGWPFVIQRASTTIKFPSEVSVDKVGVAAFTGYFGQTQKAYDMDELTSNSVTVSTSQALQARQGITVDLSWPKGMINQATFFSRALKTVLSNKGLFALLAGWLVALLIYWRTWSKHGRDPKLKEIIPQYEAPNGESPAVMRFVNREGEYDDRVFSSAIVSMASKNLVKIERIDKGAFKIHKKSDSWSDKLSDDESALFSKLFQKHKVIDPEKSTHAERLFRAQQAHIKYLLAKHKSETYFVENSGVRFMLGFMEVALWFWTFFFSLSQGTFDLSFFAAFTVGYFFLCRFANELVARRTERGASWVPQMDGFFQYLTMAEKDELRAVHPLKKTPEVYQEYLPYAVALDIEDIWGEKFSDVLGESVLKALTAIFGSAGADFSDYTDYFSDNLDRKIGNSRRKRERANAKARAKRYGSSSSGGSSWGGSSSSGGGFSGGGSSGGGSGGGGGGGW